MTNIISHLIQRHANHRQLSRLHPCSCDHCANCDANALHNEYMTRIERVLKYRYNHAMNLTNEERAVIEALAALDAHHESMQHMLSNYEMPYLSSRLSDKMHEIAVKFNLSDTVLEKLVNRRLEELEAAEDCLENYL